MNDFSPLREILGEKKEQPNLEKEEKSIQQPEKNSNEPYAFLVIITIFILGVFYANLGGTSITGNVIYEEISDSINISTLFNESTNISFSVNGTITSFRITGSIIGNGSVRIYLEDKRVFDNIAKSEQSQNLITGMEIMEDIGNNGDETLLNETGVNETNETIQSNRSTELPVEEFENYCLETCVINIPGNASLIIELENAILNLSRIDYNHLIQILEEEIVSENITTIIENITQENESSFSENITLNETNISNESVFYPNDTNASVSISVNNTLTNLTFNLTELNVTLNETLNLSDNETQNLTLELNITQNLTQNQTFPAENLTMNISENETQLNLTELPIILSELEQLNKSFALKGLKLIGYNSVSATYTIGLNENDYVEVSEIGIERFSVDVNRIDDTRLSSNIVVLDNLTGTASVAIESGNADIILKCVQFENICKRWKKTNIEFEEQDGKILFDVDEEGVYAAANIRKEKREHMPANSVFSNSNCDSCEVKYNCMASNICLINGVGEERKNFIGQVDFDILNINLDIEKAELCAYPYYNSRQSVITYVKEAPESFCSDIRNRDMTSSLISYSLISSIDEWACTDVTEMVNYADAEGYSNIFMNLIGQDLNGESFPFVCYRGIIDLDYCNGYNPAGAGDCRPYLKLTYR